MGYLDNSTVTVDAILTNKGRELLAAGGKLNITKFALSDDEIDYDLWNPTHTLGTNYYGAVIENMPVLEALPDETQMLRYKLVTLPKSATGIPVISISGNTSFTLSSGKDIHTITPVTLNMEGGNSTLGYTAILSDDTVATLMVAPDGGLPSTTTSNQRTSQTSGTSEGATTITPPGSTIDLTAANSVTNFLDDQVTGITTAGKTIVKVGTKFTIQAVQSALTVGSTTKRALLTIIGNETGGFKTISITVVGGNNLVDITSGTLSS